MNNRMRKSIRALLDELREVIGDADEDAVLPDLPGVVCHCCYGNIFQIFHAGGIGNSLKIIL